MSASLESGEVESVEVHRNAAPALLARISFCLRGVNLVGVETKLVVDLALLLVAQHIVGLRDLLELLLRLLVVGIDVGMVFARSLAKGFPDLLRCRRLLDAQRRVIVFVCCCGHLIPSSALLSIMQ